VDGIRADVAYFTQDFWMNSLAIGHPLVFQSEANSKNNLNQASKMDDTYVCFLLNILSI
jgi:hypothetical protein